jgi:type IV pilus assembly protein PilM
MAKSFISLDFGSNQVKLVLGKKSGNNFIVTETDSIDTPFDVYYDGRIINPEKLTHAVEGLIKRHKGYHKNVFITFNSSSAIIREIILPAIKSKELDSMIRYEIMQVLPIELDQYVLDYIVTGDTMEEGIKKNKILVTAIPKASAESFFLFVKNLGLIPSQLGINPLSMYNILDSNNVSVNNIPLTHEATAFVEIGYSTIDVSIFINKTLSFSRLLMQGIHDIDKQVASTQKIDIKDAINVRKKYKITENIDMQNVVSNWINDIQRVLAFNDNRTGQKTKKIYIYGGGSFLIDLVPIFKEALGLEVEIIYSFNNIKYKKSVSPDINSYVNAIGNIQSDK